MVIIAVAVIMVFAVMASLFESLVDPFIIFFSIPMLLIGVVMVYKITGEAFSIFSAVGIVVLAESLLITVLYWWTTPTCSAAGEKD